MALDPLLLEILACPQCKGDLEFREDEAKIICHACRLVYRIDDGLEETLALDRSGGQPVTAALLATLYLEKHGLDYNHGLTYYASAEDNKPPTPNRATTDLRLWRLEAVALTVVAAGVAWRVVRCVFSVAERDCRFIRHPQII